jgi:hypothetical protein
MRKWLVGAVIVVLGFVGAWAPIHHYHHYATPVTRADMYSPGDMYGPPDIP